MSVAVDDTSLFFDCKYLEIFKITPTGIVVRASGPRCRAGVVKRLSGARIRYRLTFSLSEIIVFPRYRNTAISLKGNDYES